MAEGTSTSKSSVRKPWWEPFLAKSTSEEASTWDSCKQVDPDNAAMEEANASTMSTDSHDAAQPRKGSHPVLAEVTETVESAPVSSVESSDIGMSSTTFATSAAVVSNSLSLNLASSPITMLPIQATAPAPKA